MANNKVVLSDGTVLIDLTGDTVTSASDIVSGKVGHLADGSQVTGTASGGVTGEVLWANWDAAVAAYNSSGTPQSTGITITIPTAGTYVVKTMIRNTYSSSYRYCHVRFYKNSTAVGSVHTVSPATFDVVDETITCAAGDEIEVYANSANSTYTAACSGLFICPT